jgi:hypothetical protein
LINLDADRDARRETVTIINVRAAAAGRVAPKG